MTFLGELRVEALHENLRTISQFVHGVAFRLSLSEKTLFDLELAIEEATTNIISHAYPDDQYDHTGQIVIALHEVDTFVRVTLTDWGVPLDPTNVRPFDINAPIETRIRGGMGLHFIHTLMDRVERETSTTLGAPNILTLYKRIERVPPGLRPPSPMQELNVMRTISEVMTSNIDLDDLLALILNKLVTTISAERGTLYLIDEENDELWSRMLLDDVGPLSEIRLKIGEGIAGYVAKTGEIINIPDAYADSRFNREFDRVTGYRTRSILAAPMINPQQKIIGVVQLLNKHDGPFAMRDERLLSAMASQAAISVENARLYEQEIHQQLIEQELRTAHNIQASFLPDRIPEYEGWSLAARWVPVRNVAGDFYDFFPLDDGRVAVVIADVSGKGIPASLFMALTVTMLRFAMTLNLPPGEVTRRANELIIDEQRSKMFATTFISYVDLREGWVEYASGGHNLPIVYRASTGACEYLSASGVAVGIFKGADFANERTRLDPGDILVLYTDGITEVINDDEEEFGEERIETLLASHADRPACELTEMLLQAIEDFAGSQDLFDDATLVVIKRLPAE